MPRNEAAERLRTWTGAAFPGTPAVRIARDLDEALATERRNTVDRIRERIRHWPEDEAIRGVLDEIERRDR